MNFLTRDRIIALIIFIGSLAWGGIALQIPESFVKGVPGPSFFPLTIVAALLVLSAILFFSKGGEQGEGGFNIRQALVFAIMLGYVLLVPYAGFPLATAVALFVVLFQTRRIPVGSAAVTALATTAILFLLFKIILKIPLPSGEWFA